MSITLDQKYVKVIKDGVTYNCTAVNAIKGGVTYNVWRAAKAVTYMVDNNVIYREDVVRGVSVLSPTTFTPAKSGYTFVGWREDNTANSSVLSSKTMGDNPITLYAVFKRTLTLTYYDNTTTAATKTGTQYYNNGKYNNPSVSLYQAVKDGWNSRGWSTSTAANAGVSHANGATIAFDGNYTLYGLYYCTVTRKFVSYESTQEASGNAYYNSSGKMSRAAIVVPTGASRSGWTWRGWSGLDSTAANASVMSSDGGTINTLDSGTVYGLYQQTITCTFKSYSSNVTKSGTRYYNSSGNLSNASVEAPSCASYSGWNSRGWSTSTAANASVGYKNGATISGLTSGVTYYGLYQQTITLSYNGNGSTSGSTASQSGTRYYNGSGNVSNPSFALASNGFAKTDNSFTAWAMGSTGGTQYAAGTNVTLSANTTFYAIWKAVIYWIRTYYDPEGGPNITDIASGYPDEWTMTENCCEDMSYVAGSYKKDIYAINPTCPHHTPHFKGVASGSTGGHKYAYINITQMNLGSSLVANNTTITSTGEYTIDVSGTSTLNLTLIANGSFFINDIKFYS